MIDLMEIVWCAHVVQSTDESVGGGGSLYLSGAKKAIFLSPLGVISIHFEYWYVALGLELLGWKKIWTHAHETGSWWLLGVLFKISDQYFSYRSPPWELNLSLQTIYDYIMDTFVLLGVHFIPEETEILLFDIQSRPLV